MGKVTVDELIDKWEDAFTTFKDMNDWEGMNLSQEVLEDLRDL